MCTAVSMISNGLFFGRTLDHDMSYGEEVTIMPRSYDLKLRHMPDIKKHHAVIGMAHIENGFPLYYDAMNEKGLCAAALNFTMSAVYKKPCDGVYNITHFELIPWILSTCDSVKEARAFLSRANITDSALSPKYPLSQLHWLIADQKESIAVEPTEIGIKIYDAKGGVLTNEPPYPYQLLRLSDHMGLTNKAPKNHLSGGLDLKIYSRGMGALGLPGDTSSTSRFVRATFNNINSLPTCDERESITRFFHILSSVEQIKGCCEVKRDRFQYTVYTSCCNAQKGIYYYTTYDNRSISAVDMHREKLSGTALISFPLTTGEQITFQN